MNWQFLAYVILTLGEAMVSITGLEFSYTQAPNKMKSAVMALWLFTVSMGNLFTAAVNYFIRNADGTVKMNDQQYFLFFAVLMLVAAAIFVVVAMFYRGKTYLQSQEVTLDERATEPILRARNALIDHLMKAIVLALAVSLALSILNAGATPQDEEFQKIAKDYVEGLLQAQPEYATELGDHRFDDRLTDYSPEARAKRLASAKQAREKLLKFSDVSKLTGANRVDVRILKDNIDNEIFDLEELKGSDWNPLVYNQSLANSLYLLVARDFAPAAQRIPNLRKRMELIPRVVVQAKKNLQHPPRVHTETAIEQTQGAISLVREGLAPLLEQAPQMKKGDRARPGKNGQGARKNTRSGWKRICCRVPTAISGSGWTSFARSCASRSPPICRWKKS